MESNNPANDQKLCTNCQTFYGNHSTEYMCSKCFREKNLSQQKDQESQPTLQDEHSKQSESQPNLIQTEELKQDLPKLVEQNQIESTITSQQIVKEEEAPIKKVQKNKKLCFVCNKKVGLLGFTCKCEFVFCAKHRYAEDHDCDYDYQQQHRDKLAEQNQQISSKKVSLI